jgi:hypothetical protein
MDNITEHLHKVSNESDQYSQSCFACQPTQSHECSHPCIANNHIQCNCTDYSGCAELGNDPDNLADKINCIGNPYPQRNTEVTIRPKDNTPCVVVGAIL